MVRPGRGSGRITTSGIREAIVVSSQPDRRDPGIISKISPGWIPLHRVIPSFCPFFLRARHGRRRRHPWLCGHVTNQGHLEAIPEIPCVGFNSRGAFFP